MLLQICRCSRPVSAVATVCAVLWLLKICSCATDQSDEALDKKQLTEFYKKGLFLLESEPLKRCITVDRSNLVLGDCERPTRSMLWKWVSQHRLFNLGTSTCLGLNLSNKTQPLGTFRCDTALSVLWWRCSGKILQGASQWKVTVTGRLVVVKRNAHHLWKRYNTDREGPCSRPYEDIHTLLGNAHGMPCALPFKYNNKWYYECTAEGRDDHLLWCATSTHYDDTKKWGFCPVPGYSCDHFWETNQKLQACYQFNLYTILTWSQAQSTCHAQGGNLLSITSLAEQSYIRDRLASIGAMVWIGLNHLKDGRGWQWSDGAPLSLVNFTTALPASPLQDNRQCGVYNSAYEGHWQSLSCESALPYICKKTPNDTRRAEPLENWQYIHTECSSGWWPHKGFCYRLLSETEGTWEESSEACNSRGANLTSIRSLSEVEMLLDLLANYSGDSTEVWIGLWKRGSSPTVEWSDGSPVTLTLWHQYHPPPNQTDILCAKADRKEGNWLLVSCDERLPALCRRKSQTPINHSENLDTGCPEEFQNPDSSGCFMPWITSPKMSLQLQYREGWERHRHSCYTVTNQEQINEDARIGYYCHGHLLTVEDRFEQAFVNSLLSASGANSSLYYWIGLMSTGDDDDDDGTYIWDHNTDPPVPLTFTNWNKHQPVSGSGCVVMSGGPALGRWEVKNCRTFKALSLCKQSIHNDNDFQLPQHFNHPNAPCPPGWESQAELLLCFKVFHDEKVLMKRSWVEADFFCQALGAQLTSFTHYKEQMFVKQLLSTMFDGEEGRSFWVGLNKRDPEHPGAWEWSDNTPVVTTFIEDKAEDDDRRHCAVYSYLTDAFVPQLCDAKHEWICKIAKGEKLKKPYWYIEHSEPWVFYHGAEYLLVQQPFDWDSVSLACQMMGAYLLSIHSRDELHFIKEHLRRLSLGPTDWWIGLSIGPPGEEVRWSDRTEVEFQNWAQASALGPRKDRMCATMSSSSGKWLRSKCNELHGYVCKRKTVSVLETRREPHYIGRCPEKWLYFGHKCLLLHLPSSPKEGKTWKDAESICSSFESSLVTIDSEIEQAFITMLLQGSAVGVWISLKWTGYRNWSPIESDLTEEPLCTVLSNNHNIHMTGKWYDEKCSESGYGFVCQKLQDTTKSPTHSYHHPLPNNIEYRGHNYRVISGNLSWYNAMVMCRENHFDLVSIMDAYHQAFLTVLVNRLGAPHWIGLHSELPGGISYKWSDGSETVYTHWDAEDDEDALAEDCVYVDVNGRWRRADCETLLPGALCQEMHPSSKPFISNDVVCPTTWVKFGQICYNFDPVVYQLTFEKSREHCRLMANNSDVLTIMSDQENRFVLEQLWTLGLLHQTVWLGMDFNQDNNSMAWVDGSPVDYNNWLNKSPDPKLVFPDTCVTTRGVDGVWHLSQCTEQLGFICKTTTKANDMVEVESLKGFHHSAIPAAVLGAVLIFALLAGATWLAYKKNALCFRGLPPIGSIYYRQSGTHTDSDGNVLITDLSPYSGQ